MRTMHVTPFLFMFHAVSHLPRLHEAPPRSGFQQDLQRASHGGISPSHHWDTADTTSVPTPWRVRRSGRPQRRTPVPTPVPTVLRASDLNLGPHKAAFVIPSWAPGAMGVSNHSSCLEVSRVSIWTSLVLHGSEERQSTRSVGRY